MSNDLFFISIYTMLVNSKHILLAWYWYHCFWIQILVKSKIESNLKLKQVLKQAYNGSDRF